LLSSNEAKTLVQRWLDEVVIGLQLCPFAAPVVKAEQLRYAVSPATNFDDALRESLAEASLLINTPRQEVATTLIVFTQIFASFEEFLEGADTLDELLLECGASAFVQLASFHPLYQFDSESKESLSHYTNRAPLPIFHLLRVEDVSDAIVSHPDTLQIPKNNMKRLEELGREEIIARWKRFGGNE
jgi:hypothetical protein